MLPERRFTRRETAPVTATTLALAGQLSSYRFVGASSFHDDDPEDEEPDTDSEPEPVIWTPDPDLSLNVRSLYYHNIPSLKWLVNDVLTVRRQGYRPVKQEYIPRRLAGNPDSDLKDATEGKLFQVFIDDSWSIHFNTAEYLQEEYRKQTGEEIQVNLAVITKLGPTLAEARTIAAQRGITSPAEIIKLMEGPEGPINTLPLNRRFYPNTNNLTYGILEDAVRVTKSGTVIVSHTVNHPYLSSLSQQAMEAELEIGLERIADIFAFAEVEQTTPVMVYSNGNLDNRVRAYMAKMEANYKMIHPNDLIMGYGTGSGEFISLKNYQEAPREHRS